MASKRAKHRHACRQKIRFATADAARSRVRQVVRAGKAGGGILAVYRCPRCGLFHFGHTGERA